ncbi:hypothetical protein LCGC14_2880200, partial [marine sediment metagenome]
MAFLGSFETAAKRIARLRTQLESTAQGIGDTATQLVDLEGRRRAMEDSLRQFQAETGITREMRAQRERDVRAVRPTPDFFPEAIRGVGDIRFGTAPTAPLTAEGISLEEAQALRQLGIRTGNRTIGISPEGEIVLPSETQPAALEAVEQARTQVTAPIAALGLQITESPIGSAVPIVPPAKAIQAAAGPAAEALGGVDGGIQLEAIRLGLKGLAATLPRERTLDEAFEGGIVNPFAAIAGDKEEQDKAQAVLEEAGLPRALAAEVVFDPLNLLPGVGFTKVDDVARLGRLVLRAT